MCFLLIVYVIPNGVTGLIEDAWQRRSGGDGRHGVPLSSRVRSGREAGCCGGQQIMPEPGDHNALTAAGVTKRFGGLVAVDDMSFSSPRRKSSA